MDKLLVFNKINLVIQQHVKKLLFFNSKKISQGSTQWKNWIFWIGFTYDAVNEKVSTHEGDILGTKEDFTTVSFSSGTEDYRIAVH